jgi:hypothetical protein
LLAKQKHIFILFFLFILSVVVTAQTEFKTQDELKKKAEAYFKNEDYISAMPLYSQLVSLYSKDPLYNYRFGVCALFADRRDTEKPLKYLQFASTNPNIDVDVFYYLGLVYHQNYRFAEAIEQFEIFKAKASRSSAKLDVDRQIQICKNAQSMLTKIKDIYVLEKTEVAQKEVFRSYDVERFGGKILVKPDVFKTSLDKKKEKFSLVFFAAGGKEAYFSSYGKDGKNGKDIYKSTKKADGTWSEPVNLGATINTKYDEDFPFLLGDGVTLYFSSKGSNTIGGYDIFTSTLSEAGTWSTPENLNYPINSPMDDIMFVPDSSGGYAYFSSNRSSIENLTTFYKVRIDQRKDVEEMIDLETPTDTSYAQTVEFLKEKGNLDVNATEKMFANNKSDNYSNKYADNEGNDSETNEFVIPDNISNSDIVKMSESQANNELEELKSLRKQKEAAKTISQNRKTQSDEKFKVAQQITESANNLIDPNQKENELVKAKKIKSEAEQLSRESEIALQISDQIGEQIKTKQKDANNAVFYSKEIKKAIQSNNADSSLAILNRMVNTLQASDKDSINNSVNTLSKEFINAKHTESAKIKKNAEELMTEVALLKEDAESFRESAKQSKKKTVKEEFTIKAEETDNDAKIKQQEVDALLQKSEKLIDQADSAQSQSDLYADLTDEIVKKQNLVTEVPSENVSLTQNSNVSGTENNVVNKTNIENKTNTENQNNTGNENAISNNTTENINSSKDSVVAQNTFPKNTNNKVLTSEHQKQKVELTSTTESIQKNMDSESKELRKQSDAAYNLASAKYDQSIKLKKQADEMLIKSNSATSDDTKKVYLAESREMNEESVVAAQKAVVAADIAKVLDDAASNRENNVDMASEVVAKVTESLKKDDLKIADSLVKELKTVYAEKITAETKTAQYVSELNNSLDSKDYEATNALEKYENLQNDVNKITSEAKTIRQQANATQKQSERKDLTTQAETKETLALNLQKQADSAKTVSDKLGAEMAELKLKVEYSSVLFSESSKYENIKLADKTDIQNKVTTLKTQNIFAQVNKSDTTKETIENLSDKTTANNQNVSVNNTQNKTETIENSNVSTNVVSTTEVNTTSENTFNENDVNQLKSIYIDKSITAVRSEIARVEDDIKNAKDTLEKRSLKKSLESLNDKLTYLTKEEEAVTQGNQVVVSSKMKITAFALSEILEQQADSLKNLASEARLNASKTTDATQKEQLLAKANDLESVAKKKEIEAIDIQSIDNVAIYYTNKAKIETVKKSTDSLASNTTADLLNNESKYYFDKAQSVREKAEVNPSETQQKILLQDALNNEKVAITKQEKALELYNASKTQLAANANKTNVTNSTNTVQNQNNQNTTQKTSDQTTEVSTSNIVKTNSVIVDSSKITNTTVNNKTLVDNTSNVSDLSNTSINKTYETTSSDTSKETIIAENFTGITLSPTNTFVANVDVSGLIPLDPVLPDGIVFKVQIAAVKNHVKPEIFKGITPLTGENTGTGLIRYMAGLFTKFDDANAAKIAIRTLGYNDAFVVAYYNGKRITVGEALALLKSDNALQNSYSAINKIEYVSAGTKTISLAKTQTNTNIFTENALSKVLANPVKNISGLFYSVQVGVYVRPVTSAQLYDISPLYDEIMPNGMYRYVSGIYNDLQAAVAAKNAIITKGVKDAFVVVYNNGKKITIAEAKQLAVSGNIATTQSTEQTLTAENNTNKLDNVNQDTLASAVNIEITFKVQIGAYKKDVPVVIVNNLLDIVQGNILEHTTNTAGFTIYTSGKFDDYAKADAYKIQLIAKGLTDAFVVAFQGDQKIPVTKAIDLLKK